MKTTMNTMKTTLFVLLLSMSVTGCAKTAPQPVETTAKAAAPDRKPVRRVGHRMQLEPVKGNKFALARKD